MQTYSSNAWNFIYFKRRKKQEIIKTDWEKNAESEAQK